MGKKIREANLDGEPIAQQEAANGHKSDKKKRKDKNKNQEPEFQETQKEPTLKRRLEETQDQETVKKEKKKKKKHEEEKDKESESFPESTKKDKNKKKESKKQEENGKENVIHEVKEEVQPQDRVVVSGKDTQETKYASLKSFAEAKLPDNVLECCKNFKNPSPIQAHAWPFLFDGRDFIGIAKTGSGRFCGFILCVLKCDFVVHPLIIYFFVLSVVNLIFICLCFLNNLKLEIKFDTNIWFR